MPPGITAGLVYAAMVFLVGFGLGTIRVTLIVPHLGETGAVLLETPIMLAVRWMASHWSAARFQPSAIERYDRSVAIAAGHLHSRHDCRAVAGLLARDAVVGAQFRTQRVPRK